MTSSADAARPTSPWRTRFALACSRPILRKALIAAMVVGSLLIVLNQGDLIFSGRLTGRIILKSLITPVIPFCVTMLGAVLNSGAAARADDLRPGWAAIRRSSIIAIIVGGIIIAVNQIDIILSGQIAPLVWLKMLITPCVPFCVSLYGAYLAYRNALAREQAA
jgi:hypothetical protein